MVIEFEHALDNTPTRSVIYGFNDVMLDVFIANCKNPSQWLMIWDSKETDNPFSR